MAAPLFSPSGGVGSTWTDPQTGTTYLYKGGTTWTPVSSGAGTGSVLGASTGGAVSSQPASFQEPQGTPLEPVPSEPSIDWEAMYAPAFSALGQYESTLQPQYATTVKELETTAGQKKAEAKSEEERRLGIYEQQRGREEQRTKGTIGEARRMAAEMMQGIQSRFGGTTSAGGAYSEILGAQATRNIATNQAAFQQTLAQINQQEDDLRREVTQMGTKIDQDTDLAKERAQNQLQAALAEVAQMRGQLETEKANRRLELIRDYQRNLADVAARNTAFKQQLFLRYQDAQEKINTLKAREVQNYQTSLQGFEPRMFNVGEQQYAAVPSTGFRYLPGGTEEEEGDLNLGR